MAACSGGGGKGTQFSYGQLEQLWINAGGPRSRAALMAAIAMAESHGCSSALNSIRACGLWQIHPYQNGCLDGPTNARMAVAKYQSQGLGAWQSYTNGAYKQFLNPGTTPDPNVPGPKSGGGTTATLTSAAADPACLFYFSGITIGGSIGPVGAHQTLIPPGCVFTKSAARAGLSNLVMLAGFGTGVVAVAVLAAYGLKSSGAGRVAGRALEVGGAVAAVSGAPGVGQAVHRAGGQVRSQGASRAATDAAVRRARKQSAAGKGGP